MNVVLEQFLSEARENLAYLDKNLVNLRNNDPQELDALFRAAHTLKGGAGLVGLESIKTITHHAEDLLDGIKKQKIQYTEDMLDVLYDAFDEIVEMIDATEEAGGLVEFEQDTVIQIANSVKQLMGENLEEESGKKLNTELNIVVEENPKIAELVSAYNLANFVNELPFDLPNIDDDFICTN